MWSEGVLFTRKGACRSEALGRCLVCYSSLICIVEFFANLVDGDDSPALGLSGAVFQFLRSGMSSGAS